MALNDEVTSSPDIIYVGTFRLLARHVFLDLHGASLMHIQILDPNNYETRREFNDQA